MGDATYGSAHQARRKEMLAAAYNTPCGICGVLMVKGDDLHLDHSRPVALDAQSLGDRIVHAECNTSEGGRLGRQIQDLRPSPRWWERG